MGEAPAQCGATDQQIGFDTGGGKVAGGDHHLLRTLHQQAREADDVGPVLFANRLDQGLGRHLDTEVDDLEAVVGQDDVDQVLADVVDVALDRGQDHLALE